MKDWKRRRNIADAEFLHENGLSVSTYADDAMALEMSYCLMKNIDTYREGENFVIGRRQLVFKGKVGEGVSSMIWRYRSGNHGEAVT